MSRSIALAVICVLTVAACSGSSDEAGGDQDPTTTEAGSSDVTVTSIPATEPTTTQTDSGSDTDLPRAACDLVTDEQVGEYLTVDVTGQPAALSGAGNPLVSDCLWQNTETFETFSIQYFGDRELSTDFDDLFVVEPYEGIGDEAITLAGETGAVNSLWVASGQYIVVCYTDLSADTHVVVDGEGWDAFFALCEEAVANGG
jgi:hypothetical protein